MAPTKRWNVEIFIDEDDGRTYAEARLYASENTGLCGVGRAKLNPIDEDVPEIGDELAAARALSDLSHRLLMTAATDMAAVARKDVMLIS
jgi:hypothetical protein